MVGWVSRTGGKKAELEAASRAFKELLESKLTEVAARSGGKSTDEVLNSVLERAGKDMEGLLAQGLPGYKLNQATAKGALQEGGHTLVEKTTKEYNATLAAQGVPLDAGFRANRQAALHPPKPGDVTSTGHLDYGKLPWIAGGGAALAGESAIYSLSRG